MNLLLLRLLLPFLGSPAVNVLFNLGILLVGFHLLLVDWVVLLLLGQVVQGRQAEERILLGVALTISFEAVPVVKVSVVDRTIVDLWKELGGAVTSLANTGLAAASSNANSA